MSEGNNYQRMLERDQKPTTEDILEYIGEKAALAWKELSDFMNQNYDIVPETVFYGKNYGWLVRYRKSNKTLCSFFPERNSFTFLITYGKKEVEKFLEKREEFSTTITTIFDNTKQLHDGRWIYVRLLDGKFVQEMTKMIMLKRKPMKKST